MLRLLMRHIKRLQSHKKKKFEKLSKGEIEYFKNIVTEIYGYYENGAFKNSSGGDGMSMNVMEVPKEDLEKTMELKHREGIALLSSGQGTGELDSKYVGADK